MPTQSIATPPQAPPRLSARQLAHLERRLLNERALVVRALTYATHRRTADADERARDNRASDHMADMGSDTTQETLDGVVATRATLALQEIDSALRRLYEQPKTFGMDELSGEPIPFERLDVIPWARRKIVMLLATLALGLSTLVPADPLGAQYATLTGEAPIVIGHRGASGYRPEHTLAAYKLAIEMGANFIEPDLVLTKDGVPIARHEPLFGATMVNGVAVSVPNEFTTTDIFDHPEFAGRLRTRTLDGNTITGYWADDFTLAEVKTLRARERIPGIRPGNVAYNDLYEIPTLQEVIDLAKEQSIATGRTIGIYPETKHPTFFATNAANRTNPARFEDIVVAIIHANYGNSANAPVFIQSFEVFNLQYLRTQTDVRLVQLLSGASGRPYDFIVAGDLRTYGDLATAAGLGFINDYAAGVGPTRDLLIPRPGNVLGEPTTFVADAHLAGLLVHPYTFRAENSFLSIEFRNGSDPTVLGRFEEETAEYLRLGIDGFFTDHPDRGVAAVEAMNVVPEPSTVTLVAVGVLGLIGVRRRARRT